MRFRTSYPRLRAGRPGTPWLALAFIGLFAATGCDDDPDIIGPPGGVAFNPQSIAGSVFSLRFAPDNVALAQVELIAEALGFTTPSASTAPAPRGSALRGRGDLPALAPRLDRQAVRAAVVQRASATQSGGGVPLFPINFLGKTFAYDPLTGSYYADDGLGGAPPDGVRFLLYTWDATTRLPALPLFQIGFVDLTDESNATSTRIGVHAFDTSGPTTIALADYFIDGAFAVTSSSLAVNLLSVGLLVDEFGRFDFDLDELLELDDLTGETLISIRHEVVSQEGTNVTLAVDGTIAPDGHSDLDWELTIRSPGSTTIVDLATLDDLQDGTISHNGRVEIFVGGTVADPDFTRADGRAVSFNEFEALDEILFAIDDVLILADVVFAPLADLFGVEGA
jgi:hypothetical protein